MSEDRNVTTQQVLEVAHRLTREVELCLLLTIGSDESIHARVMQPFPVADDLTLWFGTSSTSRKVREVTETRRGTATFQSGDGAGYVAVSGALEVVRDRAICRERWRDDWTKYFPDGPDHGYVLIRMDPLRIEALDFAHDLAPPPYGAVPAAVARDGDGWVVVTDA